MLSSILKSLVKGYRYLVSPWLPPACRFTPTCSQYAIDALDKYGPMKAIGKTTLRLSKCHPFHSGGHDPVR